MKTLEKVLAGLGVLACLAGNVPKADAGIVGTLKVYNSPDTTLSGGQVTLMQKTDASDNFVSVSPDNDAEKNFDILPQNSFDMYSKINAYRAENDSKYSENNTPFCLELVYKGNVNVGSEPDNWLNFKFGTSSFGNKNLILQETDSLGNRFGQQYNLRALIDNAPDKIGRIHKGLLPVGSYEVSPQFSSNNPYAHFILDFPITGDANRSGYVNDDDLSLLLANWHTNTDWAHGELNGVQPVNDDDLSLLLANWHTGIAPMGDGMIVPEPATLGLLGLGGGVLAGSGILRRKR